MSPLTLNRITIFGTGTIALVVFGALCIRHTVPAIEADLTLKAEKALRGARLGWAEVELDGRDMTLRGIAPDGAAIGRAMEIADVYGVRRVSSRLSTIDDYVSADLPPPGSAAPPSQPEPAPVRYRTRFSVNEDGLVIAGSAPDDDSRRRVVRAAQDLFGVVAVEARLVVDTNGAPADWETAAMTALGIADRLAIGEVALTGPTLSVTGLTGSDAAEAAIADLLATELPPGFTSTSETGSRSELESVLRTAPELAARLRRQDQQRPDGAIRSVSSLERGQCEARFRDVLDQRRVLFSTASADLTTDSERLLDELADVLRLCPRARITIEGHTDDQGLLENNLALSQRRAEAVMQYLVARGISLSRLSARGYGEERPLVENRTADDRAINRRIEFLFEPAG
ncbi:MAG: OmpA family protein [Gammaproteobacteria bacterium]|nr:OmpA family protein [Gammaproteobacteria bacterium]